MKHPLLKSILFVAALLVAAPGQTTSYVMMADTDLVAQASAVVEARIAAIDLADRSGRPVTDYVIEVERLLAGSVPGSTLVVRVPGGATPSGKTLKIWGAPEFEVGDRPLLFLRTNADGTFSPLHLMLGAFHRVDLDGRTLAVRNLQETHEVEVPGRTLDERLRGPREFAAFSRWIGDRGRGIERAPDYYAELDAAGLDRITQRFTFIRSRSTNLKIRWFEFDAGNGVDWRSHVGGQPGLGDGGGAAFRRALGAWNNESRTPINLVYRGTTGASAGFSSFDDQNVILYDDPNQDISGRFTCPGGGTLAIGGPWFDSSFQADFNGETYVVTQGADIVMNDGVECFLTSVSCGDLRAEEVYGHELGHTLGLGHACGDGSSPSCSVSENFDDALMRAFAHGDCRGARLGVDDTAGIRSLYQQPGGGGGGGGGGSGRPSAPTNLVATRELLLVTLAWTDRSSNETGFKVYRGIGTATPTLLATLAANETSYLDATVVPNTTYVYQVASFNGRGESSKATTTVVVPPPTPLSAAIQPVGAVLVGQPVTLQATTSGPVVSARWSFGGDLVGFSEKTCAASTFCRTQLFLDPGSITATVTITGDLGQTATASRTFSVADATVTTVDSDTFIQSVILGPRGNTGTFKTDVWLHNEGPVAQVDLTFIPRGLLATPIGPKTLSLATGESVQLQNALAGLFNLQSGQGALLVRGRTVSGTPGVAAFSRSYVELPNKSDGTFGQFVPGEGEATWTADDKIVAGVQEGGGWLGSILAANVDGASGRVDMQMFDASGAEVTPAKSLDLAAQTVRSQTIAQLFPGAASRTGPFTLRFRSNGIRFLASSTLLEIGSEDQIFLPALEAAESATAEFVIPRVAKGAGRFDVTLESQVAVLNNAGVPSSLTFQLLERGQDNTAPRTAVRTVPANGLLFLSDALGELFNLTEATGALRVRWNNTQGIAPRVLSLGLARNPAGARFGMLVDSRINEEGTAVTAIDFGAEQSDFVQASYGALNLGTAANLEIVLRDANGTAVATKQRGMLPFQLIELGLPTLFGDTLAVGRNWTVETRVTSGGPVLTYLINIDVSGDIFYVPGRTK
ncbi:MAG: hypothetical protein SF066_22285 [Thermoanaerobaculia bacterium]|nr:hypothetical protein [Thermoanaerobaculia bacterium]